jgi:hypothetical protein
MVRREARATFCILERSSARVRIQGVTEPAAVTATAPAIIPHHSGRSAHYGLHSPGQRFLHQHRMPVYLWPRRACKAMAQPRAAVRGISLPDQRQGTGLQDRGINGIRLPEVTPVMTGP